MSRQLTALDDRLCAYIQQVSLREDPILTRLREETHRMGTVARMQISPEQGQLMALLVELLGAQKLLEVGTFTGYSALVCALALPPDGQLVACDKNGEWTKTAQRYWEEAGVADKINLHLGPAEDTLTELLAKGQANTYDLMFIDADKQNYARYYELGLQLVRPGGVILIDNVLWHGDVADPTITDPDTEAIRQLNAFIAQDTRVSISLIPIGDGLTLARRRL